MDELKELRVMERIIGISPSENIISAFRTVKTALEKQMPKKYKEIHPCKSVTYYQCPVCNGLLRINENYCGECGQAIDWN